jgi:hypothetical protein
MWLLDADGDGHPAFLTVASADSGSWDRDHVTAIYLQSPGTGALQYENLHQHESAWVVTQILHVALAEEGQEEWHVYLHFQND